MTKFSHADALQSILQDAERDLASVEKDLRSQMVRLQRELASAVDALDEGFTVNSTGVIQTSGPKIDQLCGRRQELAYRVREIRFMIEMANKAQAGE